MRNRFRGALVLACTLAFLTPTVARAEFHHPFVAHFSLTAQGAKVGETRWSLSSVGKDVYVYESHTIAAGILALVRDEEIVERSEWRLHQGTLQPLSYSYRRSGGEKERNVEVAFDWKNGQAENTARGHSWRMPVPAGTLDKLSYVLVLRKDLATEGSALSYTVADGGMLKTYDLRVEGEERIDTALGPMDTLRVRRLRDSDERETLLWCAERLDYLPVMIEHREKDGTVVWRLESVEFQ